MVEALRCSQCSAPVQDDRWTNCPYCGSVLVKATINPLRAVVAPERFDAAARSPALSGLMRREPSGAPQLARMGFQSVFLLLCTVVTGVMTVLFLPAGPMALVPAAMCLFCIVALVKASTDTAGFAKAGLERRLAVWRDERIEVSSGDKHSSSTTTYFVLLEDREGRRSEHLCDGRLAGEHAPGDIGVAYVRGGVLLDFQRLEA